MRPLPDRARRPLSMAAGLSMLTLLAACSRPEPAPEPIRAVRTQKVSTESATAQQEYAGEIKARTETRLGFRVGGKLMSRAVNLGDEVKAGQVIAQLDPSDLKLGQDAAAAGLRAAQANWDQVNADLKRYRELHGQGFIGGAELERRETAVKAAQATLDQARVQVGVQGNQAQYTRLIADAAGVVTGVDAEPGAVVGTGASIVRLALAGARDVVFNVPEDRVASARALLKQPGALQVRLWGAGGEPVRATLRELAAAADPTTRTFVAKADLNVPAAEVRLGQTATVAFDLVKRDAVVRLPLAAVVEQGGKSAVWLLDPATMTVKPQPVQIAGADGNLVLVGGGVQPGQEVVTAGVHVLTAGMKVKRYIEPVRPAASR
ncbi:efflux RND transporter periplasmic adaptor subunit [Sphaerotilus sp.]|uniref:efflux RND transporter periplasmic adaptor subunit n=1 Tax=Sphaerotilus sp. TaxID=2093942 RepID=UPI002ACD4664|nr:efflux RND transporter periplasmic adaptor subunit [Sphaerotilus sp.]MDZ7856103.1 efflux RND transporter periplasmic adaptor subunit [Sphaerotilus sp.]